MRVPLKIVIGGFAIFSMLFGSSNVVFPLILGKNFGSNWAMANLGWMLAAVVIPMVGYYGAMLFDADNRKFLKPLSKHLVALLMFLLMMMVGPFGVVARGVNVSFGGIHIVSPETPEVIFNLIFCIVTIILAWHPGKIVQLLGVVFTPLKFGGIVVVTLGAVYFANSEIPESTFSKSTSLIEGFKYGYQTMDLLPAFIMSTPIFLYIKNIMPQNQRDDKKLFLKYCALTCTIGGFVLAIVYLGLMFIGAKYSSLLQGIADEALFTKVAEAAMGSYASWFVAVVIAACCLATNIILSSVFTDYIHKDILKNKGKREVILVSVGILSFVMSLLGFTKICSILAVILEKLYPALIIFVIAKIASYYFKKGKN